jgi:hypothetical protein
MALNFNVDPYYDDFDPAKAFYRVLFRPGRAVQARELTQMQSILGNQIGSFASNIFAEGSVVKGGQHQLDDSVFYLKVNPTYDNGTSVVTVDYTTIEGQYIVETLTGKIALVKKYTPATATDLPTLHVSIVSGSQAPFSDNANFYATLNKNSNTGVNYFTSAATSASGSSLIFHISEGVFFGNGTFLYCAEQSVVVGKYSKIASGVVGLNIVESITDYADDSSLLDPALGASNYLAPGADRYKIDLQLTTQTYTDTAVTYPNFIQLVSIKDGNLLTDQRTPIYSAIMDTMAKRTFDTSGDFIIKNFIPTIINDPQDLDKLVLKVSPGSAFVQGYEVEKISTTTISVDKSRTTGTDNSYIINSAYGNYTLVSSLVGGLPNINTSTLVELHNITTPTSSSSRIGTTYIKGIEYVSGVGAAAIYALYLDNNTLTSSQFSSVKSLTAPNGGNYSTPTFKCLIDSSAQVDGKGTQLYLSDYNSMLFTLPRSYVKNLRNVEYYYNQNFTGTISGGTVSISCKSTDAFVGSGSGPNIIDNYIAVETTSGTFIPMDSASVTLPTAYQATINFGSNTYNGRNVNIIARIHTTNDSYKQKTAVLKYVGTELSISNTNAYSLLKSDVYQIDGVYEYPLTSSYLGSWSSATTYNSGDVVSVSGIAYISISGTNLNNTPSTSTGNWTALDNKVTLYSLDTGQKDTIYDHGAINRKSAPQSTIKVLPVYSYFTHSGLGYISPESYPIDYGSIPTYKSPVTGKVVSLSDCIDFRPRRVDDTSTYSLASHQIPTTNNFQNVIADITYYLGRIDKIVLTRDGLFKDIQGIPDVKPQPPANQSDAVTLYVLDFSPYTYRETDVGLQIIPHKRYTMKDISNLDTRLTNMEYYTSLNFLETQVNAQVVTDNNGNTQFKNGFIVDSFVGSGVGDVGSNEYRASIDYTNKLARPLYLSENVKLNYTRDSSNTIISSNTIFSSLVTVPYISQVFVNQPIASGSIKVNPFDVVAYVGELKLSPQSDVWFDVVTPPAVIVNTNGENDNYSAYSSIETQWNAWQSLWSGEQTTDTINSSLGTNNIRNVSGQVGEQQSSQIMSSPPGVVTSSSTATINQTVVPYARKKEISFSVNGMSPKTKLYLYMNGLNTTSYFRPDDYTSLINNSGISPQDIAVYTDSTGSAAGKIYIPNDTNIKFLTGNINIVLCDNPISIDLATCYASSTFYAQGLLQTLSPLIVSSKPNQDIITRLSLNGTDNTSITGKNVPAITTAVLPDASYSLTSDYTTIREGDVINFIFNVQNAPAGKTYNANISGSIINTDLGNGFVRGNTIVRTIGTNSKNQAVVSIPINSGAISSYVNKYIILEVDVPTDTGNPQYKGPQQLLCNVAIQSAFVPTFSVAANSSIVAGNTIQSIFSASSIPSNQTVYYAITSTANTNEYSVESGKGNQTSGAFTLTSPSSSNTLFYRINSNYAMRGSDVFTIQYTWGTGNTSSKSVNVPISAIKSYMLVANTSQIQPSLGTALNIGKTANVTLSTVNVGAGVSVPYTITGVESANIAGASLTGSFTTDSNGNASVLLTSASVVNDIKNVKLKLNNILPEVYAGFTINATPIVPIELSVKNSSGVNLSTSTSCIQNDKITFNVVNGPNNGNYYAVSNYGERIPASGTLPLSPPGTTTTLDFVTTRIGSYIWTFYFNDNRQATTSFYSGPKAAVYSVSGPTSINMGETLTYVVTSTNVGGSVIVPFTITNVDGMWLTKGATSSTNTVMNVSGGFNYTGYVNSYADIKALFNDGATGTNSYASNTFSGGYTKIYATVELEAIAYFANADFRKFATQGIDAFGQWHYEKYGKAENRTIPRLDIITGTISVSDTTPATIAIYINPLNGYSKSTATIELKLEAPISQNKTTTIQSTASAVSVATGVLLTKPKIGDFVDSSMTYKEAIEAYTYLVTAGQSYNQVIADPNSRTPSGAGKMWLNATMKAEAINVVGPNVLSYYRNAANLNRNPDLGGFIYWVNAYYALQQGSTTTSAAVYAITTAPSYLTGHTGVEFVTANAVYPIAEGASGLRGAQTFTIYRNFTTTQAVGADHTISFGADDLVEIWIDNEPIGTYSNWGHWITPNWPNNDKKAKIDVKIGWLAPGAHIIKCKVTNSGLDVAANWSGDAANPAWYAAAITNAAGGTVWTSRGALAAESIIMGGTQFGLTALQADARIRADFQTAAKNNGEAFGSRTSFVACTTDPLAQTFFVPAGIYPNGVFLTGISLYFESVDDKLPVFAQIRPTVNGYPSSTKVIPLSTVWKNPYDVNTSTDASVETLFRFTDPVYLQAGEYAIVVGSNSSKTKAYYATVGQKQIGSTNTIAQQPNVGSLFVSQNGSTWTADQSSDLSFKLYYAQFDTTKTYEAVFKSDAPPQAFDFEIVDLITQELDFNNTTSIDYSVINQYNGTFDTSYTPLLANKNTILKTYKNNTAYGDTVVKAKLSTLDKNVSPVIDLDRMSMIMINNIINDRVDVTIPETTASGGNASAKYVTRAVTLASGFDAKGVKVTFDANMQSGTSFDVFVKVLAADDVGEFSTKPWIKVPNVDSVTRNSSSYTDFIEQNYFLDNISYTSNGVIHNSFQTFAVKVVMYSGTPAIIPQIKKFRAIATS